MDWEMLINKTDSGIILFFIICAVVITALAIPLYKLRIKSKEIANKSTEVVTTAITNNTAALVAIQTLIEVEAENCNQCKEDQKQRIDKMLVKQDANTEILTRIDTKIGMTNRV